MAWCSTAQVQRQSTCVHTLSKSIEEQEVEILSALLLDKRRNRAVYYEPYDKQREFHRAGKLYRERLLIAGNQLGKTYSAGMEVSFHATGKYPHDWDGKRFDRATLIWTGSETNESSKELIQGVLLGTESTSKADPDFGTGSIPHDAIFKVSTRQAGVKDVVHEILVRHVSGGLSRIVLKTYEQGRKTWQGKQVDVVWFDEEPEYSIYSEGVTRTNTTGGIVMMTFTPLLGVTKVVESFLSPSEGDIPKSVTTMTIYDAGHYTDEKRAEIISSYAEWERDTRAFGVPMAGEGRVFQIAEETIKCDPFEIPRHYARICGIDFGAGGATSHPAAGTWLAWDRDADIIYVYDCYKRSGETPVYHSSAINSRGKWIPVAWPHDGVNNESDGRPLKDKYLEHNVNMLSRSARYDEDRGGSQDVEPVVLEMLERMRTGRFKVFSHLHEWFDEFRMYHRKDGKIVRVKDDIMSATRYATMDLRCARPQELTVQKRHVPQGLRMVG